MQNKILPLVKKLVDIGGDYDLGSNKNFDNDHVMQFVNQFDECEKIPLLSELVHILEQTYCSEQKFEHLCTTEIFNSKIYNGMNKTDFWQNIGYINQQDPDKSQPYMLNLIKKYLQKHSINIKNKGNINTNTYFYVDDGIYTGHSIIKDIDDSKIQNCKLILVTISIHTTGMSLIESRLKDKSIKYKIFRVNEYHSWKNSKKRNQENCDVLFPKKNDYEQCFCNILTEKQKKCHSIRNIDSVGANKLYSSCENRNTLENILLKYSMPLMNVTKNLYPLGYGMPFGYGFGAMTINFRRCPNTVPLCLWQNVKGWYPLFPRFGEVSTPNQSEYTDW